MTEPMTLDVADATLAGDLTVPADAARIVVFVHGSGSSRHSSRNIAVARSLQDRRLATLLFDLLTGDEEQVDARTAGYRFDIELLTGRLLGVLDHVRRAEATAALPLCLFGASTGAAVALCAAARRASEVTAVVSRGGRPDLAGEELAGVRAPTLLIVGERDSEVLELNRAAASRLGATHELRTVAGASHLFEEEGALAQVAELAGEWFRR